MLKQMLLTRKLSGLKAKLKEARSKKVELREKRKQISIREKEAAKALRELEEKEEELTEEEKAEVEEIVSEVETEVEAVAAEEEQNAADIAAIEEEIAAIEEELAAIQNDEPAEEEEQPEETASNNNKRSVNRMETRKFFGREAAPIFARDDVKGFVRTVREAYTQKRAITNAGLLIPDVLLPILRQVTEEASKMMKHVNVRNVPGTSRQNIMGDIPEAVWTEMCANLNELSLSFNSVELDGYKVGGFIAVCNAILEDADDVSLAQEVLTAIGKAIGYALDKAILYGTGTKMPVGVMTRLVQTEAPSNYPATARTWVDLHTTNVVNIASSNTGAKLFQAIITASGAMNHKYASGGKFWAMSEATHMKLVAEALTINAAGAIVSGIDNTMPILGGAIEELDFIPDNVIICGYGELYLLAERAGTNLATSEHVRFIQDQTVFRGTARYDGAPVIPEAFMAIGLGTAPTAAMTFAADTAN